MLCRRKPALLRAASKSAPTATEATVTIATPAGSVCVKVV
jgi:hypothetical protein